MIFADRIDAGRRLADELSAYRARRDVLVLALPRGGVPVAAEVARVLDAPWDVFLVRKLGVPGDEEFAMGAIASGGVRVLHADVVRALGIDAAAIEAVTRREQRELARRERMYRGTRPPPPLVGRTVVLVDDGLATGATMQAAIAAVRSASPARVVAAAPVGSATACARLRPLADDVVCAETPEPFHGVGAWYRDFAQATDADVQALLAGLPAPASPRSPPRPAGGVPAPR